MAAKKQKAVQTKIDAKIHASAREKMRANGHNWSDILSKACEMYTKPGARLLPKKKVA